VCPDEIRQRHPEVAWRKIAGLRDFLAHVFFAIDDDILCDLIENKVPELLVQIAASSRRNTHLYRPVRRLRLVEPRPLIKSIL
jgi:uncharacterized protein with HEPN domain